MNAEVAGRAEYAVAVFDNYWAPTLAFVRSLGRRGILLNCYGKGAGRWSRYRTQRRRCPPIEGADEFLPWLREKVRSGEIARIAPTTDLIAYYCSVLRSEFTPEVQRTIAPLSEIENCLIKTRFAAAGMSAGQPTLSVAAPDGPGAAVASAAALGYPLMLKPKSHLVVGFAERGHLLLNEADLLRYYRPYSVLRGQEGIAGKFPELVWPLLQRYLPTARNRVYSVSGVKDADGGILAANVSFKREQWPPHVGVSTVQVGCADSRVLESGLRVVNQLLSRGIFEIELLADGDALYAIDLNPRAFGFMELDIARGADLPWLWFRSTLAPLKPEPQASSPTSFEARDRVMHAVIKMARRRPKLRHSGAVDSRDPGKSRRSIPMLGHWSDPLPKIVSHAQVLRHPRAWLRSQYAMLRAVHAESPPELLEQSTQ